MHHLVRTHSIPIQQFITTFVSSILSIFLGSNHILVSLFALLFDKNKLTADTRALFYEVKSKLISKQTYHMIAHGLKSDGKKCNLRKVKNFEGAPQFKNFRL